MGNDDQEQIAAAMRPLMTAAGLAMSKPAINAFFVDRCVNDGPWGHLPHHLSAYPSRHVCVLKSTHHTNALTIGWTQD